MRPDHRIRTHRLELTPLGLPDLAELHALWTEPSVREFLWDDQVLAPERTRALLAENEGYFAARRNGLWGVRRRGEPALIGFFGFWPFRDPPVWELLYGLAPEARGEGLATEAGRALVRHAFGALGFRQVVASADAPNEASIRVLERLGLQLVEQVELGGRDTLVFARSR